jgi:autotransporter-associated beta strand protein
MVVGASGNVTLNAANTYLGDTNVLGGTLIVTGGNAIPDNSSLKITTGGLVDSNGTTEAVSALFFDGVQQANGTWGATGSGAANINDTFFTGSGVINVVPYVAPSGFATWQAANSTTGGLNEDHDNDGVTNGVEWFLGGNADTTGFTPLPGITNTAGTLTVTWTQSADYPGIYGTDFRLETSATLADPWTPATEGIGAGFVEINGNDVKFTFPAGVKNFARLVVTGP